MNGYRTTASPSSRIACLLIPGILVLAALSPPEARSADGASRVLLSFGASASGALGRGAFEDGDAGSTPTPVRLNGAAGSVTQVAPGAGHTLAVTSSGQVLAFGVNESGELGTTQNLGFSRPRPEPQQVRLPVGAGPAKTAAAGEGFSLVVTTAGQVFAFGTDFYGQLGLPVPHRGHPIASPQLVTLPDASESVVQVAAGGRFALLLTSSGQVFSFGENNAGQLGQARNAGGEQANPEPEQIGMPAGAGPIIQIAAGDAHTLLLTTGGGLYGLGSDRHGQIGSAPNLGSEQPDPVPFAIALPGQSGRIVQIAAGDEASFALTSSGQLYSFGVDWQDQLGRPTESTGETQNPIPAAVAMPTGSATPVRLAVGNRYALVQTADGQLYGFGSNLEGTLGVLTNLDNGESYPTPIPITVPGYSQLVPLSSGSAADATFLEALDTPPAGAAGLTNVRVTARARLLTSGGGRCYTPYATTQRHRCASTTPLRLKYELDTPATVTLTFERQANSIVWHGVCMQAGASRKPSCRFDQLMGKLERPGSLPGNHEFTFGGVLDGHTLLPGRYRLTVVAHNAAGDSAPQHTSFQVQP